MSGRAVWPAALAALLLPGAGLADYDDFVTRERGLYLVRAGDCAACHTVEPDKPMAGGYPLPTPFGTIYSANITPDETTGIGGWTPDDFWEAMHEGRSPERGHLYPAFPYTHFTHVTREDSDAIFAYLRTLEPVRERVPEPELPWPLSWRFALRGWNLLFFDEAEGFAPDPTRSESWNRGRYLVEGLGHCAMCHSPKNALGAVREGEASFTGGLAEGWLAPPLTQAPRSGLAEWSKEDLVSFLKHGRNARTIAFGAMRDVIHHSTRYLTDEDLGAIADYLLALPSSDEGERTPVDTGEGDMQRGRLIYDTQCSACHAPEGEGIPHMFPRLAGGSLVQSSDPTTVVRIILEGAQGATTDVYPTASAMPAFDWKLNDADVAAVATYVRNAFGNAAPRVTASDVASVREAVR